MPEKVYDAVVVGSGPNGLGAAIVLVQHGLKVLLIEGKDKVGGGMRTSELTLPGFHHDICSAIHPMAVAAPFFKSLPLAEHGLEFLHPKVLAAHPMPDGSAVSLYPSLEKTANHLGTDAKRYQNLMQPIKDHWEDLTYDFLAPLKIPKNPLQLASFGLSALQPLTWLAKSFREEKTRALFAGMSAHGIQPLSNLATSAIGLVLMGAGHFGGWPVVKGGSQALANALLSYFLDIGGEFKTGWMVRDIGEIPPAKAILFDTSPKKLLEIAGGSLSRIYKWQLNRYRYGMGVFKMDFALEGPIPWISPEARLAGTVHLGGTMPEIVQAEAAIWKGLYPTNPYVLVAQQSLVDPGRAPEGKHTAWAYCHVPAGSTRDISDLIINQIEKSAPGFGKIILAKRYMNAMDFQAYNPNYIGGDINVGVQDITQIFTRPALRLSPYRTSAKGVYLCSSATPPGGGVHGMCGFHAANRVLKDLF
ncbi:NAD(P)/FAD-dependent oxidoreductase [Cyclobacterium sp.]|uniref:phytoene desaturase family protein n=1 Tax=Cyclobacterium sp. TaxID=1966343 RepID=UPI0019835A7F|nr:NAD(P)/FAD-dependent oxidoreductase [Cyclobacterium sp.]MBD3627187.1 NAD(P)/FAD-dependent oxidoreductase [Cyclobacterium sp.]